MKVRLLLVAYTRLEYTRVVEVPEGTTKDQLDDMVDSLYDEVDGGDYSDDPEYWEKGPCRWEEVHEDPPPNPEDAFPGGEYLKNFNQE